jgi:hypothetical protein
LRVGLKALEVEAKLKAALEADGSRVSEEEPRCKANGAFDREVELLGQQAHERYVLNAVDRDAARGSLTAAFDSRKLVVGQQIVDPFVVGGGCMSRNINMI